MASEHTFRLSANHTLSLGEEDDRILRVEKGCVELFLVWHSESMRGRRHHFASLPEGGWLFDVGFGFRDHGVSVLAVGQAETVVGVLDLSTGREAAAAEAWGEASPASRLNDWVTRIESGISELVAGDSKKNQLLSAGSLPALAKGDVAGLRGEDPLWWKANLPGAMFFGVKEVDVEFVPLAADGWVVCPQGAAESVALTSAELMTRADWLDDVARAHDLFLRTIQAGVSLRGLQELAARERRMHLRESAGDSAWGEIASVLAGEQETIAAISASSPMESLVFAFELVARRRGITPKLPADVRQGGNANDARGMLARMARKSSVRMRTVLLEGGWYRRDNGPLIGFLEDSGEAVALLPEGRRGYTLRKGDGSGVRVTRKTAALLDPFACSLYRSLPDRKLALRDIINFSVFGNKSDFVMVVFLVLLTGLLGLVTPALTGRIFDIIIPQAERQLMAQIGAILVSAALVRVLLELVRGISLLRIQNRTDANLQAAVWDRLLKMPTRFFRKYTAGDLATRAQGISEMHDILSSAGTTVLFALPVGLFNFIVMFRYNATLSFWGLGLAILALVISLVFNSRQVLILRKQYEVQGRLAGLVFQLVNGVAKFRIAGGEHLAFATWAKEYAQQERLAMRAGRWGVAAHTFFAGYTLLTSLVIFAVVAHLDAKGDGFTTGSFLAFNSAFGALVGSLISMGDNSLNLLRMFPLMERTRPIFDAEPEIAEDRVSPGPLGGGIEMANVRFRYAEDVPAILENFSLRVAPGEFVALVGPSGSGKSTIFRLLLGFETPESGTVFYDGRDLHTLDPRDVRRQIGVVLQSSSLIAGDIFRNIVGESSLTLDDAWRAAEMAGLADDIRAMPMQMHTVISEGGAGFSGGQKQRLAIARAIAHSPRLIFFDEATSALDNRTQAIVTASLEKMNATRLVIAHRLSTIIQADRIVVLRDGRVVEDGKYEKLMAQKGFFYELASRQLAQNEK